MPLSKKFPEAVAWQPSHMRNTHGLLRNQRELKASAREQGCVNRWPPGENGGVQDPASVSDVQKAYMCPGRKLCRMMHVSLGFGEGFVQVFAGHAFEKHPCVQLIAIGASVQCVIRAFQAKSAPSESEGHS